MPSTDAVYSVYLDGRPIERGLTQAQAHAKAEAWAREQNRKNASTRQRNPEWDVRLDREVVKADDSLYRWAKQGG